MPKVDTRDTGLLVLSILIGLMIANAILVWMVIDDGHDWRGDFAMYISQAQALLDGSISELYELNKYSMDNSSESLGPYLYQFGFPILLAGTIAAFGLNFYALKGLCAASLVWSIPIVYNLVRTHFESRIYPLLITISIAFHASFVVFADSILSDLPFFFFSLLCLNLMKEKTTLINQVFLGFLIYFSYSIRDIGIVLIPTLMVFQYQRKREGSEPYNLSSFIPYLIFTVLFAIGFAIMPAGQENHLKALITENSWATIIDNLNYYKVLVSRFFYITEITTVVFWLILVVMFLGLFQVGKRSLHVVVFVVLSMLILILWPYKQGMRFLFPLLPFLTLFLVKGVEKILGSFRFGAKAMPSLAVLATTVLAYLNLGEIRAYAERDTNLCYTEEMKAAYAFVSKEIPNDKVVAHYYPRVFRMFTGVNSVRQSQYAFDLRQDIDYFHGNRQSTDPNVIAKYTVIYESENEIILAKRP